MAFFGQDLRPAQQANPSGNSSQLALMALNCIQEGILIIDGENIVRFINPAAVNMTNFKNAEEIVGLDCRSVLNLYDQEGARIPDDQNDFFKNVSTNQNFETKKYLISSTKISRNIPVAISVILVEDISNNKIVTVRDISKDIEAESAQSEFISTASHEMRTPIASIEGYVGLALNAQTATIDDRARSYLEAAHSASQHLGRLFQDLLDTTKLDDHRIKLRLVPVEMTSTVRNFLEDFKSSANEKKIRLSFGDADRANTKGPSLSQLIYSYIDIDFLKEILANLVENAIKYTPEGGSIVARVNGDATRAIISVSDTGIGIGSEDLKHIFQKFYRVDNTQTRTIGGTGLGLYLVKQRTELMGGTVWATSEQGKGTTFFVSLPRISDAEYSKRKIAYDQQQASGK